LIYLTGWQIDVVFVADSLVLSCIGSTLCIHLIILSLTTSLSNIR